MASLKSLKACLILVKGIAMSAHGELNSDGYKPTFVYQPSLCRQSKYYSVDNLGLFLDSVSHSFSGVYLR